MRRALVATAAAMKTSGLPVLAAALVPDLTEEQYARIVDAETTDESCRSAQTIMSHVVAAGYGYADYIRKAFSMPINSPVGRLLEHAESLEEIDSMPAYTVATLDDEWEMPEDEFTAVSLTVDWGPTYDLEQLLEHAIVHILRHRRQIDKWGFSAEARSRSVSATATDSSPVPILRREI